MARWYYNKNLLKFAINVVLKSYIFSCIVYKVLHWNRLNDYSLPITRMFILEKLKKWGRYVQLDTFEGPGVSVLVLFVLIEGRLLISYWLVLQMIILLPGAGQTRMWNYYIGPKSFFKWIRPKMVPKIFSNGTMVSNNFLDLKSIFEIWNKFLNFKTQFEIWN